MSYYTSKPIILPYHHTTKEVQSALNQLMGALPDHPVSTSIVNSPAKPSGPAPFIAHTGKEFSVAGWHAGSSTEYIAAGEVDRIAHIADLTTDERERITLDARKHHDRNVMAVATLESSHTLGTVDSFMQVRSAKFLGLFIW